MPRLLFISWPNFMRRLFKSGDQSRAVFIYISEVEARPQTTHTCMKEEADPFTDIVEENKLVLDDC